MELQKIMGQPYWDKEERRLFAAHITKQLKRLIKKKPFMVWVQSESVFLADNNIKNWKGSTRAGWSVWIRETYFAIPFDYNEYIETAIHEAAHVIAYETNPQHKHGRLFKDTHRKLLKEATKLRIWPKKKIPSELIELFSDAKKENRNKLLSC